MVVVRRILTLAVFVGLLVLGWRLAGSNGAPVTVNYLAGEFTDVALWMVLLASFVAGALAVGVWALLSRMRQALVARRYRKTVASLEAEVHQLRNLPLGSQPVDEEADTLPVVEPAAGGRA